MLDRLSIPGWGGSEPNSHPPTHVSLFLFPCPHHTPLSESERAWKWQFIHFNGLFRLSGRVLLSPGQPLPSPVPEGAIAGGRELGQQLQDAPHALLLCHRALPHPREREKVSQDSPSQHPPIPPMVWWNASSGWVGLGAAKDALAAKVCGCAQIDCPSFECCKD